jgi:hypothetical protein
MRDIDHVEGYEYVGWTEGVYLDTSFTIYECQKCYSLVNKWNREKHTEACHAEVAL